MLHCAFLSINNTEGWFIDDDLVFEPLQSLGWTIENIPWNASADWNKYDLVVIRSPWDYQDHLVSFLEVLETIDQSNALLLNELELVKWNIHKHYLFELESKGVELVPTMMIDSLDSEILEKQFMKLNTNELIVKPTMGANADDTYRLNEDDEAAKSHACSIFSNRGCFIQPFMTSVIEEGEFSLMYFNGKLSHTILKTVGAGDYRVQEEHGGGVLSIPNPEAHLVAAADKAMNALPKTPLYARVDLVRTPKNTFALMELELIEPCLYFRFDERSPMRFANKLNSYWLENKPR